MSALALLVGCRKIESELVDGLSEGSDDALLAAIRMLKVRLAEKEAYAEECRRLLTEAVGPDGSGDTSDARLLHEPLVRRIRRFLEIGILCPDCGGIGTRMVPFTVDDADACPTCNGLGELPPRSSDPEDTTPAPACPDCQRSPAVGNLDGTRAHAYFSDWWDDGADAYTRLSPRVLAWAAWNAATRHHDARNPESSQVPKQEPTT
jgi:hypothetical protein